MIATEHRHILIVANRTAAGSHLKRLVRQRMAEGPCSFTLLVPATAPTGKLIWTDAEVEAEAERRMHEAVAGLREIGAEIEGRVEDGSPMDAVVALMQIERFQRHEQISEIIVSTLPAGMSRWLKQDLPHRLERRFKIPVTHVIGDLITATV